MGLENHIINRVDTRKHRIILARGFRFGYLVFVRANYVIKIFLCDLHVLVLPLAECMVIRTPFETSFPLDSIESYFEGKIISFDAQKSNIMDICGNQMTSTSRCI